MPTDPNMTGLIYPTEGDDDDVWDTILNTTCWPVIGAHTHTSGDGVPIASAALRINADVPWSYSGTSYAITAAKALDFAAVAASAVSSYAGALFVNSDDSDNLYFRTTGGSNVQLTDGTSLNVAAFVGGIGGDYSSVSALLDYDDASDTYRFRQETSASVRQYAKISIADLIIREYDAAGDATVPAETVTIKSPDSLAASYEITLPAALPATSNQLLSMSTTGVISVGNQTLEQALVLGSGRHFTLTGDGTIIHGTRSRPIPIASYGISVAAGSVSVTGGVAGIEIPISSEVYIPLIPGVMFATSGSRGEQLQSVTLYADLTAGAADATIMSAHPATGAFSAISSVTSVVGGGGGGGQSIAVTTPTEAAAGITYWLRIVTDGSSTIEPRAYDLVFDAT